MKKKTDEIADNFPFFYIFFKFTLAKQLFHQAKISFIAEGFQSNYHQRHQVTSSDTCEAADDSYFPSFVSRVKHSCQLGT